MPLKNLYSSFKLSHRRSSIAGESKPADQSISAQWFAAVAAPGPPADRLAAELLPAHSPEEVEAPEQPDGAQGQLHTKGCKGNIKGT